ncbi:uncharacterized protein LOC135844595 [Planococcus citri]|uniref:uncharacterized protein LOC135844595 n=1 Tax=Planococcus citri TaxID=170843 RepID=UPI0031F81F3E
MNTVIVIENFLIMEVIRDVKKIVLQAFGKENMFGFETTLANQLYLIYCMMGNIYYTDKIHKKTKVFWFCSTYSVFIQIVVSIISYLIYGRQTGDLVLLIYTGFATIFAVNELIVKPAIVFLYRNEIERMILAADRILMKKTSKFENEIEVKHTVINALMAYLIPLIPYVLITVLDMALFYEEEKVHNYKYYVIPFSGLEHHGSLGLYSLITIMTVWQGFFFFIVCSANRILTIPWIVVCHNETQHIINELNTLSKDVDINIDNYKSMEPKFKNVLKNCIQDTNNLRRFISIFRGYLEATAGIILPVILYVEVTHALVFILPGTPIMVRMKEFCVFISTILEVYMICWVGATLEDMTSDLSYAVYSTPWYWSKNIRKDVYIFLCEAQAPINPVALSVYPLTLATFLRFCNVINSTVNVFRAYTQNA